MAQRMESVATHGGVMVSESTARLVEGEAELGERRLVCRSRVPTLPSRPTQLLSVTGRRPATTARARPSWVSELGDCLP